MVETKFKQTDVGLIPNDWTIKSIGEITYVSAGGTPSTKNLDYWGGLIPWMNSGELNLKIVNDVEGRITELGLKKSSTHLIPPYCVLVGLAGQGKTRGTVAYNTIKLCTNQSIAAIYPASSYNSIYLYYYLDSKYNFLRSLSDGGGGRGGLTKKILEELIIPLPPLIEQQRIASTLTAIDYVIDSLDKLISKTRDIKQGMMQELFINNANITYKMLDECLDYEQPSKYIVESTDYCNAGIPVLTAGQAFILGYTNERKGIFEASKDNPVIIFDDFTTSFHWVDFNFKVKSSAMKMLRPLSKHICFKYVYYAMNCIVYSPVEHSRQWISLYSKFTIPFPSLSEQQRISSVLTSIDNKLYALKMERNKYEMIKQGMMQQLLTGKIRLKA